jgi:hypothetical protein
MGANRSRQGQCCQPSFDYGFQPCGFSAPPPPQMPQLTWTYAETEKKLHQMCGLIAKARHEIEELDKVYPELKTTYFQKYMDARKQAGLSSSKFEQDQSFMKYLVEDLKLPAVEAEYQRLFGQ